MPRFGSLRRRLNRSLKKRGKTAEELQHALQQMAVTLRVKGKSDKNLPSHLNDDKNDSLARFELNTGDVLDKKSKEWSQAVRDVRSVQKSRASKGGRGIRILTGGLRLWKRMLKIKKNREKVKRN